MLFKIHYIQLTILLYVIFEKYKFPDIIRGVCI
jgi:hypothetical protein